MIQWSNPDNEGKKTSIKPAELKKMIFNYLNSKQSKKVN
jgi:hypothetical protein